MAEVTRSNPRAFDVLFDRISQLDGVEAKAGWFESAKYPGGTPVAYVASIQEFGSVKNSIPPRPFMRPTIMQYQKEWRELAMRGAQAVLKGHETMESVMGKLAQKAIGDVAKTITEITSPVLSPITIEIRAMRQRDPNLVVTGKTIGIAAARVREPGYVTPNVSKKPLVEPGPMGGIMLNTLSYTVEKT